MIHNESIYSDAQLGAGVRGYPGEFLRGEMSGILGEVFPASIFDGSGGMSGEICTAWVSRSSCRITSRAGAS